MDGAEVDELPVVVVRYPTWVADTVEWDRRYENDHDKMGLAIDLARRNVEERTGGPFGAAIYERDTGRLVSVGMNLVVPSSNSVLHAEIVAFMTAEQRLGSYTLGAVGMPAHEVVASSDPCAMCLAAALWAGVTRVVSGAAHADAERLDFDEGPVFPESFEYLEQRGIEFHRGVRRDDARAVLELYRSTGGPVYNG